MSRRRVHVATGSDAKKLKSFVVDELAVRDGSETFHIAQCLSFLLLGTDASTLSKQLKVPKNKFALRKLRAALAMLDSVFEEKPVVVTQSTDNSDTKRPENVEKQLRSELSAG